MRSLGFSRPVVVFVQNAFGLGNVDMHAAALEPGQTDDPFDVVAHHRGFGRHGRHQLEFLELLLHLGGSLLGHALALDALFQLLQFVGGFVFAPISLRMARICSLR
jgi:hypothetical protein